jgi:hypothetical protein
MPSQRIDKLIFLGSVVAFSLLVLFYDHVVAMLLTAYPSVGTAIAQSAGGILFGTAAHRLYKILAETNDLKTTLFRRDVMDGIGDVKRNVVEVDCKVSVMGCRLERVEQAVDRINVYGDVKKRRWSEYDSDWNAVKMNFEKLRNNDVYAMGRIVKDSVREYSHEITLSDLSATSRSIIDFMEERGRAYTEDIIVRAKQMLPPQYVDFFRAENCDNRDWFRCNVIDLLENDKINNRAEKIHLLCRQFLGRTHNTIYTSWVRWSESNKEKLSADPVEKYFKSAEVKEQRRHEMMPAQQIS